jgi:cbb3-type cytochrome oxidase subunit 1
MLNKKIEVLAVNGTIFGISFANIENTLRILLLILSIVYTIIMIAKLINKKDEHK